MVIGLFLCNDAYSNTIKDMSIICDSNEHIILSNGEMNTDTKQKSYEIYIINNQASLAYNKDGVTIFDYIDFKLKNVSDEEYFFENKNNDEKLFAKIVINRIKGTALVSHNRDKMALTSLTELVYLKNCKLNNNKPKF